jgi:hypothetical protein
MGRGDMVLDWRERSAEFDSEEFETTTDAKHWEVLD